MEKCALAMQVPPASGVERALGFYLDPSRSARGASQASEAAKRRLDCLTGSGEKQRQRQGAARLHDNIVT
jgi:hypothetical protein